jgi:predicted MPP superfamily phosphohydrolase
VTAQSDGISRSVFLKTAALILGGSAVAGFLYGITNRYNYKVKRIKLSFGNLPAAFKGLKIVQISDIHSGSFDHHDAVARGVEKVLAERPDLIFFTGDLVNNKAEEIKPYMDIFSRLKAPLGVYSTLGNHDYGDYVEWDSPHAKVANLEELKQIHGRMGWKLMMNEHVVLDRGGDKIAVLGIENWSAKANFPKYGDMRKAYDGLAQKQVPFKILLSHDPSHFDAQVSTQYKDVDLTLSGHTHGMQFGVDIPGFKWSPVKYVYSKWAGLYQVGAQYLYVNRGYGFLGYPGRLGIMPEITVLELV